MCILERIHQSKKKVKANFIEAKQDNAVQPHEINTK